MSDLKKLFKKDRLYWIIITVVMLLVVIYLLANEYGLYHKLFHLENYLEWSQYLKGVWDAHPELSGQDVFLDEIPSMFLERMVSMTVIVALIAQAVRLLAQETQNRTEVLRTFPVKSRNLLTCHYLSGLPVVVIPLLVQTVLIRLDVLYVEKHTDFVFTNKEQLWIYAVKAVIIFMLHYSLLLLCRKIANHVPGTIFTFFVVEFAIQVMASYCLHMHWDNLAENSMQNWIFWAIIAAVFVILSYIADKNKDYARTGFYAFPIAHWVMMGIVFGEIYFIFYGVFGELYLVFNGVNGDLHKVASYLVSVAASLLITGGVHFVTKPKTI